MGKIFLPVTGSKHDNRSIEIAALIAMERGDTIHLLHIVQSDADSFEGNKLLKHIEAKIENYGVVCTRELAFGGDGAVADMIIQRLRGGKFYLGVLSIRSSFHRETSVLSDRMARIIREIREVPLVIVQEVDSPDKPERNGKNNETSEN